MNNHPINLTLRFLLELFALYSMGRWAWVTQEGISKYLLAIGLPLVAAAAWGIFRVPNDPGNAMVAIPGWSRLLLETVFFGLAILLLWRSGAITPAKYFLFITLLHYIVSYDRIAWIIRQ
ncbi:YrdB family protein [Flavihumibacter rivuli]|uniref:YrdB family protein n=1 Tax=Flavihumibacter rivuli TaxID=2838156 RepID=UPI001BDE08F0|nr:YrdB family protein [Flavihumibacter rivuli]ULQ55189.1 YrdB family protein [Flavihumibacter rivuli]